MSLASDLEFVGEYHAADALCKAKDRVERLALIPSQDKFGGSPTFDRALETLRAARLAGYALLTAKGV